MSNRVKKFVLKQKEERERENQGVKLTPAVEDILEKRFSFSPSTPSSFHQCHILYFPRVVFSRCESTDT